MVPHIAERLVETLADLAQTYVFKIKHFQRLSLNFGQFFESGAQSPEIESGFDFTLHIPSLHQLFMQGRRVDIRAMIKPLAPQVGLLVQRTAVGYLYDPDLDGSPQRVKECRLAEDIEEGLLDNVLGFAGLAKDAQGDAVDQVGIAVEQQVECSGVSFAQQRHQPLIAGLTGLRSGRSGFMPFSRSRRLDIFENRRSEKEQISRQWGTSNQIDFTGQSKSPSETHAIYTRNCVAFHINKWLR